MLFLRSFEKHDREALGVMIIKVTKISGYHEKVYFMRTYQNIETCVDKADSIVFDTMSMNFRAVKID